MKKTRIFACLLALTMLAGLMTACGKKAEDVSEPVTEESAEAVAETETAETETAETETAETEPVITSISLADADTGITVEGKADAAALTVADVESDVNDSVKDLAGTDLGMDVTTVTSYDISIANAEGTTAQPAGEITVTIPISEDLKAADGNAYAVYYFNPEDSFVQNMDCSVSEDSVTFQTTHFSVYSVVKFTDPAMEPMPIQETEEAENKTNVESSKNKTDAESSVQEKSSTQETTTAAANLPGENRNGRYADIPESVMPTDGEEWYFLDNPTMLYTWSDGVKANVWADYNQTQLITSFSAMSHDATGMTLIAEQYVSGIGIVIYNGQYAIVKYDMLSRSLSEE